MGPLGRPKLTNSVLVRSAAFDPLADASVDINEDTDASDHVHIRVQQRNGKKSLTTVSQSEAVT